MFTWLFAHWQPVQTRLILGNKAFTFKKDNLLIPYTEVTDVTVRAAFGRFEVVIHTYEKNYVAGTFLNRNDASLLQSIINEKRSQSGSDFQP